MTSENFPEAKTDAASHAEVADRKHPDNLYRIYESIWRNMARENDVMNYRLTWAILFSAGVFTATSILLTAVTRAIETQIGWGGISAILLLMSVLSATGVVFSVRARQGVIAAQDQHDYLRKRYNRHSHRFAKLGWPRPFGERIAHDRGNKAAMVFPVLLIRIWMSAAIIELALASAALTFALVVSPPATAEASAEQKAAGPPESSAPQTP
jgi:hypothetical protein